VLVWLPENVGIELTVGVPLLLDIIDIADPGRGVGLGLGGGPSESVSSAPDDTESTLIVRACLDFGLCSNNDAINEVEADEDEDDREEPAPL
jgi:hypothetical protein